MPFSICLLVSKNLNQSQNWALTGILLPAHIWADLGAKSARKLQYLHNRATCNITGAEVYLYLSPTQGLCSNPGHQSKGHHLPLEWCACQGSSPALGGVIVGFFSGSDAWNLEPPTMGIAVTLSLIVTAIPLRWWQTIARSKAHDPRCQFGWSAAHQADNNFTNMAIRLAPLNLHQDSMTPAGAKRTII